MFRRLSPLEKEWNKLQKQEAVWLEKRINSKESAVNQLLSGRVPANLQSTLDKTFSKAFYYIFEKGTGIIEKTYNRSRIEEDFLINDYTAQVKNSRKSLKAISKSAASSGSANLLLSGVSGIGLGILGVGMPDIVLFTSLVLKSIYQIALNYGYSYESDTERQFILMLIETAVSHGKKLEELDRIIDDFIMKDIFDSIDIDRHITAAAGGLSKELLYMKFIQSIPLVGAVGGSYNLVYMKRITKYAELKYRRRFYTDKMLDR